MDMRSNLRLEFKTERILITECGQKVMGSAQMMLRLVEEKLSILYLFSVIVSISSVQFSCPVESNSLRPHGL